MKRLLLSTCLILALGTLAQDRSASAGDRRREKQAAYEQMQADAAKRAETYSWHGDYYHTGWGTPVALVVPPTVMRQTNYSWGVGGFRVNPIDHQYGAVYPGPLGGDPVQFMSTPTWPTDTNQFGVYYVRGPWW